MISTDSELLARVVVSDDRAAFAELVRRHQGIIRGFLRRLCRGDHARADDLAQEVFLKAYQHMSDVRNADELRSWLAKIAYRTFLNGRRKQTEAPTDDAFDAPHVENVSSRLDVERAMRHLPERERAVLTLTFMFGATNEEVARTLDCPLGTVKSDILRGREKLRAFFAPLQLEEQP